MLERASGQFTIDGNVEDIFGGISGAARIARISQTCRFTGTLEGESIAEYTAVLPHDGNGSIQGFQRISGTLGEREGSFVVCVTGEYAKGLPRGSWTIVPKSGSGDFVHIRGGGAFSQTAGKPGSYKFEFDLRKPRKGRDAHAATDPAADELVAGIDFVAEEIVPVDMDTAIAEPATEPPAPRRAARPRKTAVAAAAPIVAAAAPIESTPAPKRSRKRATPPVETATPETSSIVDAPPKRNRKRAEPPVEPLVAESLPVETPSRKRGRKTAMVEPAEPAATDLAIPTDPKPMRRKKQPPTLPEPLPLPVAQEKPPRQRKAKAA